MHLPARGVCGALLGALLAPALAADPLDAVFSPPPLDAPPLALAEALALALERDPELEVSRLDPRIAKHAADRDAAAWDSTLQGNYNRTLDTSQTSSRLDGARVTDTDEASGSLGVVKPLRAGGSVEAEYSHRRSETNSSFTTLNPAYRAGVAVTLRRPLLRGRRVDTSRRALHLSRVAEDQGTWTLRGVVLDTLARTERAYWALAEARRRHQVARLSLDQAETLRRTSQVKVDAGALAPIDVLEADAAVTERRAALVGAARQVAAAEATLLRLIDPPPRPGAHPPPLADAPAQGLPPAPPYEELVRLALTRNPQYRLAVLEVESEEIQLRFARDQLLPKIDMVATLRANGVDGGLGGANSQAATLDFPRYFVGFSWELPLGRRAARAEHARRRLTVERAVRRLEARQRALEGDTELALRRYRVDLAGVEVSEARVAAAAAKLAAEEGRYEEGLITADDLLRFQRELAEARSSEVSARAQASQSALELWVVSGTLADQRGVSETAVAP